MAPSYKLTYFNATGLAEPIRMLLAYGNLEFEDERLEWENWGPRKNDAPFGKCPLLNIDGKLVHQSSAICRYLAKTVGLNADNDWDNLQCDIIVDTINDFRMNYSKVFTEQDEDKKKQIIEKNLTEHNPFYLKRFEDIVEQNGGHFVGEKLTWADIYFTGISELLSNIAKQDILKGYDNLKKLTETVQANEGIAKYRASRPESHV